MFQDDLFLFHLGGICFFFSGRRGISFQLFLAVTAGMSRCTRQRCSSIPFVGHRYCHCEWHAGALELFPRTSALLFLVQQRNPLNPLKTGGGGGVVLAGKGGLHRILWRFFGAYSKMTINWVWDCETLSNHNIIGFHLPFSKLPYQNQPHVGRYTIHGSYG